MSRVHVLIPILASALGAALPAWGQTGVSGVLSASDTNGDGKLERSEAPIEVLAHFSHIDQDGDGAIDSYEAWDFDMRANAAADSPAPGEPAGSAVTDPPAPALPAPSRTPQSLVELVHAADRDGDRRLSRDELPAALRDRFRDIDPNGDGYLDLDEAGVLDERRNHPRESEEPQHASMVGTVRLMDTDGDGRLQKREAPLRLQAVFEQLDANGDGAIDADEAARIDAAIRAKRSAPGS